MHAFKTKWKLPYNNEEKRLKDIVKLWISDETIIWKWNNPMQWVEIYKPTVICLWYDQKWFSDKLEIYIKEHHLDTKIFRINSFKEDIYKSSKLKESF